MILDIYKDSLEYGVKDGATLLKLGLMIVLSIFIIPIFLALGYDYRILKTAVNGQINGGDPLPEMDDLISMFVDGLKLFVVGLVYLIIPLIVLFLIPYLGSLLIGISPIAGEVVSVIGYVVGIVLLVISYLLMNLAFARLAETDSLKEAFNFKELWNIASEIGWLRLIGFNIGLLILIFVVFLLVALVLFLIFGLLSLTAVVLPIPFLSFGFLSVSFVLIYLVMGLAVLPYLSIVQYRAFGLVYNLRF